MLNPTQRTVAVSYAWKTEDDGENAGKVDEFCQYLQNLEVNVLRDVEGLKLGDSLSTFMQQIGTADYLCVFLSKAYLESPNCMYELLVAYESRKYKPEELKKQVKVWLMPDARLAEDGSKADRQTWRFRWIDYWKKIRDEVEPHIKKHAGDGLASAELESFNRIKRFADAVGDILHFFTDTLSPRSLADFETWAKAEFPPPTPEVEAAQVAEVFTQTVRDIEKLFSAHSRVPAFLSEATEGLVENQGGRWSVSERARQHELSGCGVMQDLVDNIDSFAGGPTDWAGLRDAVGGLAVLSTNRTWVLEQRWALRRGEPLAAFARQEAHLGAEQRAHFLPLVVAALADGCVDIVRVFGEVNRMRLSGDLGKETAFGPDRRWLLKKLLIREVLGSSTKIRDRDENHIQLLFKEALAVIRRAADKKRDPYFATGSAYREIKANESLEHPELQHLILVTESDSDSLDQVFPEAVDFFSCLHEIFQAIQRRLLAS